MLLGCKRAATCGKRLRQQQHIWRCSKTKSNATPTKHQAQWGRVFSVQIAFHTSIEEGMRARQYIYQTITLYHNGTTVPQLYHNCTTLLYQSTVHKPHGHTRAIRCRGNGLGRRPTYFGRDCLSSTLFWSHCCRLSVIEHVLVTKQFAEAHPTFGRIHGNFQF